MAQGLPLFLAFLIALCLPSANLPLLDGLPLSRLPEFAALAAVVPFLLFSGLRGRQAEVWAKIRIRPRYLWMLLGAVLLLKAALAGSGAQNGFSGCYRSPVGPTQISHEDLPPAECERSYENVFGFYPGTRLDETIRFGPDVWNLVFVNTSRYNFYDWEAGNVLRERIPLEIRWIGIPEVDPGEPIRIDYVGEGSVVWGDVRETLPPFYGELHSVEIEPPRTESPLQVYFSFDDGSRSGQDPAAWGPKATIRVWRESASDAVLLRARSPGWGYRALAMLADAILLAWLATLVPSLWSAVRRDVVPLAVVAAAMGMCTLAPLAPAYRGIGITLVLAAALAVHIAFRPFRPVSMYLLAVAAAAAIVRVWASSGFGMVLLRSAGNDALSYESQAYSILATGSLRGGESVFFYIPGFRYLKFLEHALFGDGDMIYGIVQIAAFLGGVFVLFREADRRAVPAAGKILLAGLGAAMIFLGGYYVSGIVREGLSEYPTWIILLWALPVMMEPAGAGVFLAGTAALAVSYTIRPNQAPGILWVLILAAAAYGRRNLRTILLAGAIALGIALLPLIHNVAFGGQWQLSATAGGMSINLLLTPAIWLGALRGDASAAETVRGQMGMLFLIAEAPKSMLPTLVTMAVCFLGWLATVAWAVARRNASGLLWLAVPVGYLAVHLVYGLSTYYPRHIFIGYLAMAAAAVLVLLRGLGEKPAAGAAVESK